MFQAWARPAFFEGCAKGDPKVIPRPARRYTPPVASQQNAFLLGVLVGSAGLDLCDRPGTIPMPPRTHIWPLQQHIQVLTAILGPGLLREDRATLRLLHGHQNACLGVSLLIEHLLHLGYAAMPRRSAHIRRSDKPHQRQQQRLRLLSPLD